MGSYHRIAYNKNNINWKKSTIVTALPQVDGKTNRLISLITAQDGYTYTAIGPFVADSKYCYDIYKADPSGDALSWKTQRVWRMQVPHDSGGLALAEPSNPNQILGFWGSVPHEEGSDIRHSFSVGTETGIYFLHEWGTGEIYFSDPCAVRYQGGLWVFTNDSRHATMHYFVWDGITDPTKPNSWAHGVIPNQSTYQQVSAVSVGERLYVAHYSAGGDAGYLSWYQGGEWRNPAIKFSANVRNRPAMVVFQGLLYILYQAEKGQLYYQTFDGNCFGDEILACPQEAPVDSLPVCIVHPVLNAIVAIYTTTDQHPVALYPAHI